VIRNSQGAGHRRAVRPRRLLIAVIAALVPALAGCEAGVHAPTQQWHQPTNGAGTILHGIAIRNVFVLGAPLNATLAAGQSAGLFLALDNQGSPDRLVSVAAPGTAKSVQLAGGTVRLATGKAVLLTGPRPAVVLTGLTHALPGGSFVNVVLNFQNAGRITLSVPVMPRAQYYSTLSPAPTPTPTPTATPKHKTTAKPTPATSS